MIIRRLTFFGLAIGVQLSAQIANLPGPSSVTGAPYSATRSTERIQTLADGTHITQAGEKMVFYRDSAGRTRTEFTFPAPSRRGGQSPPVQITIVDPVAGLRYQLNSRDKAAQRFAIPMSRRAQTLPAVNAQDLVSTGKVGASPDGILATNSVAAGNPPKMTSEALGTQIIEGLNAEGTRRTTTWAVGTVGNDREIVVTNETWFSKQLQITVLTKTSDPRSGDSTTKLADISLVEPDPALFVPPPDYTIRDVGAR